MSFYSLLVRDPKRGWIVGTQSENKRVILATAKTVNKSPDFRTQVLETDGNSRNVQGGLAFVQARNGKGLAKIFNYHKLAPKLTLA